MNLNGICRVKNDISGKTILVEIDRIRFYDVVKMIPHLDKENGQILKDVKMCLNECKEAIDNDGKMVLYSKLEGNHEIDSIEKFIKWVNTLKILSNDLIIIDLLEQ